MNLEPCSQEQNPTELCTPFSLPPLALLRGSSLPMAELQTAAERGSGPRHAPFKKNMNSSPPFQNPGELSFEHPGFQLLLKFVNKRPRPPPAPQGTARRAPVRQGGQAGPLGPRHLGGDFISRSPGKGVGQGLPSHDMLGFQDAGVGVYRVPEAILSESGAGGRGRACAPSLVPAVPRRACGGPDARGGQPAARAGAAVP